MNSESKRPHIIVATTAFAPFLGGAEVAVQELMQQLSEQFQFTVVTARMNARLPSEDAWNGSRVIRVGWGTRFDKLWLIIIFPWYAWKLKHDGGAQLVWAIMASYAGAAACLQNLLHILPYALTLQEGDDLTRVEHRVRFVSWFFKQIFVRASGVQAIAPFLAAWARHLGATQEPVVVPNGVSCDAFYLSDPDRRELRREVRSKYGIPADAPVILSVSRLVEKNGIHDLIVAMDNLPGAYLLLVGDGVLRPMLEEEARHISDRIHFLGVREQHELPKIAAAADVFCRPALSEGQGIVFLEALCMKLPVVATHVGGIPDVIEHDVHGLLVSPRDTEQLVRALQQLITDPDARARMQAVGAEHVKKFSWHLLAPRIADWLSNSLNHSSQS